MKKIRCYFHIMFMSLMFNGELKKSFKFTDIFELLGQTGVEMESGWFGVSLLACFMFP